MGNKFHASSYLLPLCYWPDNVAEATNYTGPASVAQVFVTDFAWGNWDPDSPYPTGPVGNTHYGNRWR
jgi:hypothetical protein